jgi:hypothetical protein
MVAEALTLAGLNFPQSREGGVMGEAVRWGRLSNGTYETHGTYGLCLKSPVGRVTPIGSSAHGDPMSIATSWLLKP